MKDSEQAKMLLSLARKNHSLKTVSDEGYMYEQPGTYTACVKVVDVFGADTGITVEVDIRP